MIRYGIIGTGMMGIEHIQNVLNIDGAEITALADPNKSSLELARGLLPINSKVTCHGDYREIIKQGVCDAVVVASPNMTHHGILMDLMDTGLHILVEKPLCTTVEQCNEIVDKYNNQSSKFPNRIVWVGLEYRFMPPIARLIQEVANGVVGELKMLAIREHRYPFLQKVDNWNRFNRNSGGTLVEKCCHFFDLMRLIVGSEPIRVMASGGQDVNHLDELYNGERPDILDNAYVIVDFENGVRALLDLCMFAEATYNQEELAATGNLGKIEALIPENIVRIGRRGKHFVGNIDSYKVESHQVGYEGFHHGSSYIQHLEFLKAITSTGPTMVSLIDGMKAVAIGIAAQLSIAQGRPIEMGEVFGHSN